MVAEQMFGRRDATWEIGQPTFTANGPNLRHALNGQTVWVELSQNAAGYWPTAVFELAHEVVHMLDPMKHYTNTLEEGVAVAFQHMVTPAFSGVPIRVTLPTYLAAESLVVGLGMDIPLMVRTVRERYGRLSGVTTDQLRAAFPHISDESLNRLAGECSPR
jgi:hypothetical protein